MNDLQLAETAKLLLQEYYFLKIEDLRICFDRMKLGHYGQTYDRIDGNVILGALKVYTEERINVAENLTLESHKELKESEQQDLYFVKIGEFFIREDGNTYEEIERKELATSYAFDKAIKVKRELIKFFDVTDVKIVYSTKSDIGLIDYLKEKKPELAKEIEDADKHKKLVRTHAIQMAQIEASNLSELEKENKKRGLSGLLPITQYELDMRKEMYKTTQ